jgi:hypothetical protein
MVKSKAKDSNNIEELLRTFLIVQLRLAGLPQRNIQKIVGCDVNRVSKIIKSMPPGLEKDK